MSFTFTTEELERAVEDFPKGGFFSVEAQGSSSFVIFYEFICDSTFQLNYDNYEVTDVHDGFGWTEVAEADTLEGVNNSIAEGKFNRFRYIVSA